ncbi:methylated-DNA--[protein]-cysteine S-methyltransferase [Jatrophihabitans sp. DSM 45814]
MNTRHAIASTVIGDLTLVAHHDTLIGVYFPQHWTKPAPDTFGAGVDLRADAVLELAGTQLGEYLSGQRTSFELPTAAIGDAFERRVWAMLAEIPFGKTTTYGELADELGDRALAQTVGQAVWRNPLSIIVPCHRVVGKGGKLTGYAGGLTRKQFLLDLEAPELAAARLF